MACAVEAKSFRIIGKLSSQLRFLVSVRFFHVFLPFWTCVEAFRGPSRVLVAVHRQGDGLFLREPAAQALQEGLVAHGAAIRGAHVEVDAAPMLLQAGGSQTLVLSWLKEAF